MKRWIALTLFFAACATTQPKMATLTTAERSSAIEQVRQAERSFAKAFADRDKALFASMIDPNATFIGGRNVSHGRDEVMKNWDGLLSAPTPPFSWEPQLVEVNGDGTIGLSSGPVKAADGKVFVNYSSIWQKQSDGSWKVIFDGPGCPQP